MAVAPGSLQAMWRRLQIFINRCLKKILRIYWPNNIFNTERLQRANMECMRRMVPMISQKWEWIGHTLRKDEKYIARKAMKWNHLISAGRLPGRPRETWRRTVASEPKIIGKSWNELKALAHNRTRWKTVLTPYVPHGIEDNNKKNRLFIWKQA